MTWKLGNANHRHVLRKKENGKRKGHKRYQKGTLKLIPRNEPKSTFYVSKTLYFHKPVLAGTGSALNRREYAKDCLEIPTDTYRITENQNT